MLGWNSRSPIVVRELGEYLAAGSTVTVAADSSGCDEALAGCTPSGLAVAFQRRRATSYLASRRYAGRPARTLVTLLHLRDIASRDGATFTIVSEMLDDRNRQLAQVTKVDDVIVSEKLVALMIAQISENRDLARVRACIAKARKWFA